MYCPYFHVLRFEILVLFQCTLEETYSVWVMLFKLSALQNVPQNSANRVGHLFPISEQDGVTAVFPLVTATRKVD